MNSKKMFCISSVVLLMAITVPASAIVIIPANDPAGAATRSVVDPRVAPMMQRLNDIKAMDKSTLSRMEKKSLRKEVKEIKEEMKTISGGVYLSVGAIIIVILLLILLL